MNDDLPWERMPGADVNCMKCLVYAGQAKLERPKFMMMRRATRAQKDTWQRVYATKLIGFIPCADRIPSGFVHWGAVTKGSHRSPHPVHRLCDGLGDYPSAPRADVNCLTCLARMSNMESIVTKETLNEKIERHLMNRLATLPLGKNDTLRDLTNHLIHVINVVEMKGVHQRQVYDLAGRALISPQESRQGQVHRRARGAGGGCRERSRHRLAPCGSRSCRCGSALSLADTADFTPAQWAKVPTETRELIRRCGRAGSRGSRAVRVTDLDGVTHETTRTLRQCAGHVLW